MLTLKRVALFLGVLFLGAAGWFVAFEGTLLSLNHFQYQVRVERPTDTTPIRAVHLRAGRLYLSQTEIDELLRQRDHRAIAEAWQSSDYPADGRPVEVGVRGTSSESMLGITTQFSHDKYLIVVAELTDGRRVGTVAEIPDARTTREMRVTLP